MSEADRKFVLPSIPVGSHDVSIVHVELERAASVPATISQAFETRLKHDADGSAAPA